MIMFVIILGSLLNYFEKYLPIFIVQIYRYGKFSYTGKSSFIKPIQVPKAWFRHFYVYSTILVPATLCLTIASYYFNMEIPHWIIYVLDLTGGYYREPAVTKNHVLLALTLLSIQCLRRFYDTQFVSVFGEKSKMDLSHYLVGFIHYTACILAILIEAPTFARSVDTFALSFNDFKLNDYIFTGVFLWACLHQYRATVILANLRKNKKGEVVSQKYQLPKGDWFDYLSSPHSTAEIIMYFSLSIILWGNITWLIIFFWVLTNQVQMKLYIEMR